MASSEPSWLAEARRRRGSYLRLSGKHHSEIPEAIGELSWITSLSLSNTSVRKIPDSIGDMIGLVSLTINGSPVQELPESVGKLGAMGSLDLRGSNITKLPESIASLDRLRFLLLDDSHLSSLPEKMPGVDSLWTISANNTPLQKIPNSIGNLSHLRILSLENTQVSFLPDSLGALKQLSQLNLKSVPLSFLPDSIGGLASLTDLFLSSTRIEYLPETIGELANLRTLDLSSTPLREVSSSVGRLGKLENLFIRHAVKIARLPESIGDIGSLKVLDLGHSTLEELPESIGRTRLHSLHLERTNITRLPDSATQIESLRSLHLDRSKLASLPEGIGKLRNLTALTFPDTRVSTLPASIGDIPNLYTLDLRGCPVRDLPNAFSSLDTLTLEIEGCPLRPSILAAASQGPAALRTFLANRRPQSEELYEAKLLLVGEGNVGKTSILRALMGEAPNENEPTTHGAEVELHALDLPHPGGQRSIRFNVWDFGGQEVYRVTHQFFFSPRSVYLLVWEPRRGVQNCQVEDWLRLIRLRVGDEAKVLIVSTHCRTGNRIAKIDKPMLLREFGSMVEGFLEIDSFVEAEDGSGKVGLSELKLKIADLASTLDQMGEVFPRSWREARDDILALEQPRIGIERFLAICQDSGLDELAGRTLAGMLDELGYIVYYPESEELSREVVIQPEWLTKAIGFVLENRSIAEADGILEDRHLEEVWLNHKIPDQPTFPANLYPFFLRLMERFDVSYRLENREASLVAQHVSQVRPSTLPWVEEAEVSTGFLRLTLVFEFEEVPEGLIPWMIVRTHTYSLDRRDATTGEMRRLHWQKGMFLQSPQHGQALLELRGRELRIHTEAAWPQHFLGVVRTTVENLIEENWPGLKGRYSLRVPCKGTNDTPCDGRFDLEALQEFLADGDVDLRCQGRCRSKQQIRSLLFGFESTILRDEISRLQDEVAKYRHENHASFQQLRSQIAKQTWTLLHAMGSDSKHGPRLFLIEPLDRSWRTLIKKRYRIQLWCEAEDHEHPVEDDGKGCYEVDIDPDWILRLAPYANRVAGVLGLLVPFLAAAGKFLPDEISKPSQFAEWTNLMKTGTSQLLRGEIDIDEPSALLRGRDQEPDESSIKAFHALLREADPHFERLGLKKRSRKAGDWVWLCPEHYAELERSYEIDGLRSGG